MASVSATAFKGSPYTLFARCSSNNTILTLSTDSKYSPMWGKEDPRAPGMVIFQTSSGRQGFKKAARGEFEAASQTVRSMFNEIKALAYKSPKALPIEAAAEPVSVVLSRKKKAKHGIDPIVKLTIALDGFGQGRDALIGALTTEEGTQVRNLVKRITDQTPVAIGGPKPKKMRRL